MQLVWFKRDLRVFDHEALAKASEKGPVLPVYIFEPELWQQPDVSARHFAFLLECLAELNAQLTQLGQPLVVKIGSATEVLDQMVQQYSCQAIWSHQETWNGWTYQRDLQVLKWAQSKELAWHELAQFGVVRRLKNRNGWAGRWARQMSKPCVRPPEYLPFVAESDGVLPGAEQFKLQADECPGRQRGGRKEGLRLLDSFLYERGQGYTREMSSPVTAPESCSRISAHLAFGVLSMREVYQAAEKRRQELKELSAKDRGKWPSAIRSFSGRLRWHCHFIQKLEDEPRLEFENLHPAYNGLRENDFNPDLLAAWKAGKTGYPMIDACMRSLIHTGWINFRMRAMLMSFAAYHLWLHWREPALYLARLFTDYEPGIHYSQAQMQSGTTGINSIRIYNPIKQGVDQDPDGVFIRRWIPELKDMPDECIHKPWECPEKMGEYPMPIVDEKQARKKAADQLYALRKGPAHKEQAGQIVNKHGSRKSGIPSTTERRKKKTEVDKRQMSLF